MIIIRESKIMEQMLVLNETMNETYLAVIRY